MDCLLAEVGDYQVIISLCRASGFCGPLDNKRRRRVVWGQGRRSREKPIQRAVLASREVGARVLQLCGASVKEPEIDLVGQPENSFIEWKIL